MFTIKPNKEESKLLNWLRKAASKDTTRGILQYLYVKNGQTVAIDGFRMHIASTPECLKEHEGEIVKPWDKGNLRADTLAEFDQVVGETYPNIQQVFPTKQPVLVIGVNPKYLIDALSGIPEGEMAKLVFYTNHEPILISNTLTSDPDTEGTVKALVMPVFLPEKEQ